MKAKRNCFSLQTAQEVVVVKYANYPKKVFLLHFWALCTHWSLWGPFLLSPSKPNRIMPGMLLSLFSMRWSSNGFQLKLVIPTQLLKIGYLRSTSTIFHSIWRCTKIISVVFVSDIPVTRVSFGRSLNPKNIVEGADVYFECHVRSNPHFYNITWRHNVSSHRLKNL